MKEKIEAGYEIFNEFKGMTIPLEWVQQFRCEEGEVDMNTLLLLALLVHSAKEFTDGSPIIAKHYMVNITKLTVPAISKSLKRLREGNILSYRNDNGSIVYDLNTEKLALISGIDVSKYAFGTFDVNKHLDRGVVLNPPPKAKPKKKKAGDIEETVPVKVEEEVVSTKPKNKTPYGVYELLSSLELNVINRGQTLREAKLLLLDYDFEDIETCVQYLESRPGRVSAGFCITTNYLKRTLPMWVEAGKPTSYIEKGKTDYKKQKEEEVDKLFDDVFGK